MFIAVCENEEILAKHKRKSTIDFISRFLEKLQLLNRVLC